MKVTLGDIAKIVGISKNSVSRALNDSNEISEATKVKVKKVAKDLGYVRNRAAKTLRSGKSNLVGIVFDDMLNPYFSTMSKLLRNKLLNKNYDSLIFTTDSTELDLKLFNIIISKNVDAIISFIKPSLESMKLSKKYQVPIICLGRKTSSGIADTFITNDVLGGKLAFNYLYNKNCKKIGYMGPVSKVETSIRRLNGFKVAAKEKNLEIKEEDIFIVALGKKIPEHYFESIMKNYDGIFCYNDLIAYDLLLNTNNKINIVGFDNIQEGMFTGLTLTTISSDKDKITTDVVTRVIERINNFDLELKLKEYEVNLVERIER